MFFKTYFYPFFFLSLAACGGGSSDTTANNPSANTPTSNAPVEYTLKLALVYKDQCGESKPHPYVEVFIHDQDWNVLESKKPDNDGTVEFTRSEQAMAISFISHNKALGEQDISFEIDSYALVEFKNHGEFVISNSPEGPSPALCDCAIGDLSFTTSNGKLLRNRFRNFSGLGANFSINDFEICKDNGSWVSKYATFTNDQEQFLGAIVNNFDDLYVNFNQLVYADLVGSPLPRNEQFNRHLLRHVLDTGEHTLLNIADENESIYYFADVLESNSPLLQFAGLSNKRSDEQPDVKITTYKRDYTADISDINSLINDVAVLDFSNIDTELVDDNGEFDFSSSISYPFLWSNFEFDSSSGTKVTLFVSSATKGKFPAIDNYSDYLGFFDIESVSKVSFTFFDYANLQPKTPDNLHNKMFSRVVLTPQNYLSHYRKKWEYTAIEMDGSSIDLSTGSLSETAIQAFQRLSNSHVQPVSKSDKKAQAPDKDLEIRER